MDPDTLDTHAVVWNWGDGSSSPGVLAESNGSGTVKGEHSYSVPGVYRVMATVTDQASASGQSVFEFVVVYDPGAGFVAGGGWISSPAGAYSPNPVLTGMASFGFQSKYQRGTTVPFGHTQFQFHAADLSFESTRYQWLVIAGPKAQFKGEGSINGTGVFDFLLTAIDGQQNGGGGIDRFRIKIWDRSTGQIIYDNQPGADNSSNASTVITKGSIVIHK